ncbi:hypothetical protein Ccar_16630 [Clostridium carboxidivorans P7]|uniref:hypothetical protein n=1 Tax=Clostridium carboxidivorans TaxID=217159 RepID=UPI00064FB483|nr:hypothetical protein [Clostridium carboxidivorans]AKN32398.1 hypothetical protein Ccar_16630 [Clostridium carboxidivorans P7]
MNKYLVSYVYKSDRVAIGSVVLDLNKLDVESLGCHIKIALKAEEVVIINVVKLKKENQLLKLLSGVFRKIFKKQIMKHEFKQAKKKEFKV